MADLAPNSIIHWFFTAPHDKLLVRRGDPLGLRAATTRYADVLAPGLSNRTSDARWITLLSWMLTLAHDAWKRRGGGSLRTTGAAQVLYDWLRPMELLWVGRSLQLLDGEALQGRQLPGRRAVKRWCANKRLERFGMSSDQYQRYRTAGIYGAYRVLLRSVRGLTIGGDGWTPDTTALVLKEYCQKQLRDAGAELLIPGSKISAERFWIDRGWARWDEGASRTFLPESNRTIRQLPREEQAVLRPVLFDADRDDEPDHAAGSRQLTLKALSDGGQSDHAHLCAHLETKLARKFQGALDGLGTFARLADAGMTVMNTTWEAIRRVAAHRPPRVTLDDLLKDADSLSSNLRNLRAASRAWLGGTTDRRARDFSMADALAERVRGAHQNPRLELRAVLLHHQLHGGGRRWLRLEENVVSPDAPLRESPGSPYRFRLYALARMGVQCGVLDVMPQALQETDWSETEEEEQ